MKLTADEFVSAIRKLPLTPAQSAAVEEALATPATKELPRELIRRGALTEYQAKQILAGKSAELTVGRYVILDELGAGGMGQVFKARDTAMDRVIALKLIRPDRLTNPAACDRFRQEVRAAARLTHPNIVRAYDTGTANGRHFLATEFVAGHDLGRELARRGALPPGEACEYARQCAAGLQHAHEQGLVHRDIKPANLLFSAAEKLVKIADFGLARLSHAGGGLTADGVAMGTPDYIAPEQASSAAKADIRSDLYSLGCTLYHFLTGHVPYPSDSALEKLVGHASHEPVPLDDACPGLNPALVAVVRKLMAKNPADRYQTPLEAADALAPFCPKARSSTGAWPASGSGPVARPAPLPVPAPSASTVGGGAKTTAPEPLPLDDEPEPQPVRRNRGLLYAGIGLGAGALVALATVIVVLVFNKKPDPNTGAPNVNVTVPVNVTVKIDDWPRAKEPGVVIFLGDRALGAADFAKPMALAPGKYTLVAKKDGTDLETREFDVTAASENRAVSTHAPDPAGAPGEIRSWGPGGPVTDAYFHPNGKRFAAIYGGGEQLYGHPAGFGLCGQRTYDVDAAAPVNLGWTSADATRVAVVNEDLGICFSLDGRMPTSVRYITLFGGGFNATGSHRPIPDGHSVHLAVASADGKRLLWSCMSTAKAVPIGTVRLEAITVEDRWKVTLKELNQFPGATACFDPSGRKVFVADKTALTLYAEGDGKAAARYAGATANLTAVHAPDAGRVAAGDEKGNVYVWNATDQKLLATAKGHAHRIAGIVFTPDGKRMVTASWDGTVRVWDPTSGAEIHKYKHDAAVYALAMSPGGKRVLSGGADKTIRLWQLPE